MAQIPWQTTRFSGIVKLHRESGGRAPGGQAFWEKTFEKSWKKFLTNAAGYDKVNELPLRTEATNWTLKMKDWTVFKTLKILKEKSLFGKTFWIEKFRTKTNQTTVERLKLASG